MPLVPHRDIVWDDDSVDADATVALTAWAPSDDYNAFTFYSTTSIATLSGVVPTRDGRPIWISYTGTQALRILHDNAGASADEYRLLCPGDQEIRLEDGDTALLWYSTYDNRWRVISGTLPTIPDNPTLYKVLDSADGASNSTGAQPWFPTAGAVTVEGDTLYRFDGELRLLHGTTSCAVRVGFGGTATLNFIAYQGVGTKRTMNANGNNSQQTMSNGTSLVNITTANTVGGAIIRASGIVSVDAAGTFIPQFGFTAAPGGLPAVQAGTYFEMVKLGADTALTRGTWA